MSVDSYSGTYKFFPKSKAKAKKKLNPHAQRLILENDTFDKIKTEVDYANSNIFRSFRLKLSMEEEQEVPA